MAKSPFIKDNLAAVPYYVKVIIAFLVTVKNQTIEQCVDLIDNYHGNEWIAEKLRKLKQP